MQQILTRKKFVLVNKYLIFLIILVYSLNCSADSWTDNQIADAIYRSEGGEKAKVPYGILSVKTSEPRKICLNTIRNHRIRHAKHNCGLDFITCLGNRYCPSRVDKQGNKNWIKNVKFFLKKLK